MAEVKKKHGLLLTIWLILMLAAGLVSSIYNFMANSSYLNEFFYGKNLETNPPTITVLTSKIPFWTVILFGVLSVFDIVFVIFLFKWKKWAFYGFIATAIVGFMLDFYTISITSALYKTALQSLGLVILYLLLRPKWNFLE